MFRIVVIIMVSMASARAMADGCRQRLEPMDQKIIQDMRAVGASSPLEMRDEVSPSLILLDPIEHIRKFPHELQTARDYSEFLSQHGKQFVYVGDYRRQSVPIFDGLIRVASTREVIANVSLKYASIQMTKIQVETLVETVKARLNHRDLFEQLHHPGDWFRKANSRGSLAGIFKKPKYPEMVIQARTLMDLFGLFQQQQSGLMNRELRTVLDVRDHGYPFDFFKNVEVQSAIMQTLQGNNYQNQSLTLLWNRRQVIEFSRDDIKIYE